MERSLGTRSIPQQRTPPPQSNKSETRVNNPKKKRCQDELERGFDDSFFEDAFRVVEKKFLERCRPPDGFLFYDFLDCLSTQTKRAFTSILKRENLSLEALGYYLYFFIRDAFKENRDDIMESLRTNSEFALEAMIKVLTLEFEAKITGYLQRQAT